VRQAVEDLSLTPNGELTPLGGERHHAVSNCVGTGSIVLGVRLKSPIALLLVIAVLVLGAGMPPGPNTPDPTVSPRDL
jgi:hypothetical protein